MKLISLNENHPKLKAKILIELEPGEHLMVRSPAPNQPLGIKHNGIIGNTALIYLSADGDADEPGEYPNPTP